MRLCQCDTKIDWYICLCVLHGTQEFVARYNEKMQAMHKRGAEMISTYEELLVSSLTPIHLVSSYKGQAQNP